MDQIPHSGFVLEIKKLKLYILNINTCVSYTHKEGHRRGKRFSKIVVVVVVVADIAHTSNLSQSRSLMSILELLETGTELCCWPAAAAWAAARSPLERLLKEFRVD